MCACVCPKNIDPMFYYQEIGVKGGWWSHWAKYVFHFRYLNTMTNGNHD
jgi:hypothetical protein